MLCTPCPVLDTHCSVLPALCSSLCSLVCAPHSVGSHPLCRVLSALASSPLSSIVYIVCTLHSMLGTVGSHLCALCSLLWPLPPVLYSLYSLYFALRARHCGLIPAVLCALCSGLSPPVFYNLQSVLRTSCSVSCSHTSFTAFPSRFELGIICISFIRRNVSQILCVHVYMCIDN